MSMRLNILFVTASLLPTAVAGMALPAQAQVQGITDRIVFGDKASEAAHGVTADHSDIIEGPSDKTARRLLPLGPGNWKGGNVAFSIKIDPERPNYVSIRQWGEDETDNRQTLFCDGKQVGYRQIGDVPLLDEGTHAKPAPGRFITTTEPLPVALTRGKSVLQCRIEATGPFWWYGNDFATYQKPMTTPARPIYELFSQTDPFVPDLPDDGHATPAPVRPGDGSNVLNDVKSRVDKEVGVLWGQDKAPSQLEINFLARAYQIRWSKGYQASRSLDVIVDGIDAFYRAFKANPKIALNDPATPNTGWFGFGLCGEALKIVAPRIGERLDETIPDGAGHQIRRREAYAEIFKASRDINIQNRRLYSNQSMIKDTYGIWYDNEGLIAIESPLADARETLLPFFYESVGLQEWTGSHNAEGRPTYRMNEADASSQLPKGYRIVTRGGLTKELGFVGGYGEVLDWLDSMYVASKPNPDVPGDAKVRAQMIKIAEARANFRFPQYDADGYRSMRLEGEIGWRDHYFPGDVLYLQRTSWDSSALSMAVLTKDPRLVGYAQQMVDDNQFFSSVAAAVKVPGIRQTIGLLDTVDDYHALKAMAPQPYKLPMSASSPDTVFADPEDGVVAVKNGKDIFYAELYWRANYGVNHLGRAHLITSTTDRAATVYEREEFTPDGETFIRPNNPHINGFRFSVKLPGDETITQAQAAEKLPVAKLPEGSTYESGQDNPYAGRADYYELRYGPYIVAINASADKTFELALPAHDHPIRELSGQRELPPSVHTLTVKPGATYVVYTGHPV